MQFTHNNRFFNFRLMWQLHTSTFWHKRINNKEWQFFQHCCCSPFSLERASVCYKKEVLNTKTITKGEAETKKVPKVMNVKKTQQQQHVRKTTQLAEWLADWLCGVLLLFLCRFFWMCVLHHTEYMRHTQKIVEFFFASRQRQLWSAGGDATRMRPGGFFLFIKWLDNVKRKAQISQRNQHKRLKKKMYWY